MGTDPSADPGAKTEGRTGLHVGASFSPPFGIGRKAINPSGRSPEHLSKNCESHPQILVRNRKSTLSGTTMAQRPLTFSSVLTC